MTKGDNGEHNIRVLARTKHECMIISACILILSARGTIASLGLHLEKKYFD